MKILNFTAVEILPSLLDKSKVQTIRPVWKKEWNLHSDAYEIKKRQPRFKVGDKVKLLWNQRSKYEWFCRKHGVACFTLKGMDAIGCPVNYCKTKVEGMDIAYNKKAFKMIFNKHLSNTEITEVFKIEMQIAYNQSGSPYGSIKTDKFGLVYPLNSIKLGSVIDFLNNEARINFERVKELAKFDGFKSVEDMFNWFDKYDLSSPKQFWVYRWEWIK